MRYTILFLGLLLCSCIEPKPANDSRVGLCSVYEFSTEDEAPVCAIRCAGYHGYRGWDSLLPVNCT